MVRYGPGPAPVIQGGGVDGGGVLLENQQYWTIQKLQAASDLIDDLINELGADELPPGEGLPSLLNEVIARFEARGRLKVAKAVLDSLR